MINYTNKFFNLEILRISDIKLHETTETNRLRNIYDRITSSKFLMNPVIVGRYDHQLMLIDGANRLGTLKEIGCKLIIAQIIDYKKTRIKLKNWNHLIYEMNLDLIVNYCTTHKLKFKFVEHKDGSKILKESLYHVLISDIQNRKSIIISFEKNFNNLLHSLNNFTKLYFNIFPFDRSEEEIRYSDLCKYSRMKGLLVEYPKFTKNQIIKIANLDVKLPAGISRHILENRVLHVRYDISKLLNEENIEVKNNELKKYLTNKIDNNKVRQYRESVIVFDE